MRVGGGGIRTCDLRFIRRGSQPIELLLGDFILFFIFNVYDYQSRSLFCLKVGPGSVLRGPLENATTDAV